jgi:hypothetical protein
MLQTQRRNLLDWFREGKQAPVNEVLEAAVRVSTGTGLRLVKAKDELVRRWGFIEGKRSDGRFTVASNVYDAKTMDEQKLRAVVDDNDLGVEINVQIWQLTLKTSHLRALDRTIANNPDVRLIFGAQSMQCATVQSAEHREWVRLIGRHHDLHYWKTADPRVLPQVNDRDYNPGELENSEMWIVPLLEPVRL